MRTSIPDKHQLEGLYANNSIAQLSKQFGVSTTCVHRWLNKYGIKRRTQKQTAQLRVYRSNIATKQQIVDCINNDNMTVSSLAKHFHAHRETVKKWLVDYNIAIPDRCAQLSAKYKVDLPDKQILQALYVNNTTKDIGNIFNVSDVLVSKWFKQYQIEATKRASIGEQQVIDYLNSVGGNFVRNDKTVLPGKLELDGYDQNKQLAIEYCGLYWHNETQKRMTRMYHYNKWKMCQQKSIRLITIFEDEWLYKRDQVKQFLAATVGQFDIRIHARDCQAVEIDQQTAKQFINQYHIQGAPRNVTQAFALTHNGDIIGAVSIGKHHRDAAKIVLNRICFKQGVQVVGGGSKLIHKLPRPIYTWSDNRWTDGNLYKKCRFVVDKHLAPDYSYVRHNTRKSKQSMKEIRSNKCSEKHAAALKGWARIWDCGKIRWVLND